MSKFLKLLFVTIVGVGFLSTSAVADAGKGQKLFIKEMKASRYGDVLAEKLIESFNMGKELICNTKVVSLKNGYSFDEKNETVSEGVNIFRIKNCHEKD